MSNFYEGNNYGYNPNLGGGSDAHQYNNGNSSTAQQQQFSHQSTQQQQPQQTFWNPTAAMSAAAAFTSSDSDAMYNVAESMGKQFLETGWAKAVPGLERTMLALRPYFAVDNGYVKKKMGRVLFPFVYRDWIRLVRCIISIAQPMLQNKYMLFI